MAKSAFLMKRMVPFGEPGLVENNRNFDSSFSCRLTHSLEVGSFVWPTTERVMGPNHFLGTSNATLRCHFSMNTTYYVTTYP